MTEPLVVADRLRKVYRTRSAAGRRRVTVVAVDGVSFQLAAERSLAIVGESGSGKTTVARLVVGLERPTSGSIVVCGRERRGRPGGAGERLRRAREVQIVFQDPYASLDPRQCVADSVDEVLGLHDRGSRLARRQQVSRLLELVGLDGRHGEAVPRMLSAGQRQRAAIARALAVQPRVLVLDEAVALLDVSIQAQILNLLADIREQTRLSYIVISHDLAVVRQVADEILVMQAGGIVERGPTARILTEPAHPHTRGLLAAVPRPGWLLDRSKRGS